jgi:glycine cleavage system H protein
MDHGSGGIVKTYTDSHEWIEVQSGMARVGLAATAVQEIGTIVTIELPKVGVFLSKGDTACVVESTKAAIETYAPVSGTVTSINRVLHTNLSLLNMDPEGKGWLYEVQLEK